MDELLIEQGVRWMRSQHRNVRQSRVQYSLLYYLADYLDSNSSECSWPQSSILEILHTGIKHLPTHRLMRENSLPLPR